MSEKGTQPGRGSDALQPWWPHLRPPYGPVVVQTGSEMGAGTVSICTRLAPWVWCASLTPCTAVIYANVYKAPTTSLVPS